jgi:hypothetical protein
MRKLLLLMLALVALLGMAGCGGGGTSAPVATGSVKVQMDLAALTSSVAKRALATTAPTITSATITLSRAGYPDINQDLTVTNNIASGTISGLVQGYWHVTAKLYSDQSLTFTGSTDVNVIAGAQVAAQILLDPASGQQPPDPTGSVSVSVGFNPYPGYTKIQQFVSTILQDKVNQKLYIYDSSTGIIAVYDAATLVREKDLTLPSAPQAFAVDPAGGSILLGFSTGKIYRLQVSDGSITLVADSLLSVTSLVPITSTFLLVCNDTSWGPSNNYVTINVTNGQIVSSKSDWYPLNSFTFNPVNSMTYALDSGLSPADIHRIVVNPQTGSIDLISDSRYHGDYYFGGPIRVINNGTRIVTASGNMFISSPLSTEDITYAGNIGHTFIDLASDDALGYIYMLNSDNIKKLLVLKQDTLFTSLAVDLVATPMQLFNTPDNIVVFVKSSADVYAKVISKSSLGIE